MSGIAGIIRLDGAPADSRAIERMLDAMAHRGPDDRGSWSRGSVAFGYAALHTTPESYTEKQPLVDAELALVADARIDNRDAPIGDATFILAAYRKWGSGCVARLDGDFSFAIWNERERTLFCARDPFGVRPFVYALVPGKLFAFASEARALLALEDVPRDVDERRVAELLAIQFNDASRTFHRELRRLPAGCTLALRDGALAIERYWRPENVRPLRLRGADRDVEYARGFREHFERAVRERLRLARPTDVGAMLSGGLDSTSIAFVARDQLRAAKGPPLPVFSWIFSDELSADEREYQQAAIDAGGLRPITLDSARVDATPWTDLDTLLLDGPPYAPNHYLNAVAARHARDIGVRVLLDGTGGDSTISRGPARFVELFVRMRPFTLARELRALASRRGTRESLPRLFAANVALPLMSRSMFEFLQRLRGRPPLPDPALTLLAPRMRRLVDAAPPRRRMFSARQEHLAQFTSPMYADGLEVLDRSMAMHGVEGRFPFFDRRLAEYCLSLPADQKLADGYSRIVARRALEGVVPSKVLWRAGKGSPGLHVVSALRRSRALLDDLFLRDPEVLAPYVDIDVLRATYADFLAERPLAFTAVVRLWSAAALARWLRR